MRLFQTVIALTVGLTFSAVLAEPATAPREHRDKQIAKARELLDRVHDL